jgi:hypothetical protein
MFPKWAHFQETHAFSVANSPASENSAAPSHTVATHGDSGAIQQLKRQYATTNETENLAQPQVAAAVSKMLDLDRHREELGARHMIILNPKESPTTPQDLSILPK